MTCWLIIPVKPADQAKSRLAEVLGHDQRAALAEAMLCHVMAAARAANGLDHVTLIGPSRLGLPNDVPLLPDPGCGLNPAMQSALDHAMNAHATRMVILFADLPRVTAGEIEQLAAAPAGTLAIAPDRHGTGTNALSLPLPAARGFTFAFGPDSFALHLAESARHTLPVLEIRRPGLANDIDVPEDLGDAAELIDPD